MRKIFCILLCIILLSTCSCAPTPSVTHTTGSTDPGPPVHEPLPETFFYRPPVGALADVIPYYEDGKFYLYYLHDYRDIKEYGIGVDWDLLVTEDFIHFEDKGTVIRRGLINQQDNCVYTGGIIKDREGLYHIFYTGHNALFIGTGTPQEAVMHAVSRDKVNWSKLPEDTFFAPEGYMMDDWRDPFVYYDEAEDEYVMLLAARVDSGSQGARGVTAMLTSRDLHTWQMKDPLYAPQHFHTHECPDLFKMGEWYYLIFSEFSARVCTRYAMSRDLVNWTYPTVDDMFDGRGFYAAKSVGDEEHRYLFGWIPTKQNNSDAGTWEWGGSLAVHELYQMQDGKLGVRSPAMREQYFSDLIYEDSIALKGTTGRTVEIGEMPSSYKMSFTVSGNFEAAGYAIQHTDTQGYRYVIDTRKNTFSFENYPTANVYGDVTVPVKPASEYNVTVFVEGNVCTAYVNGEKALSTRVHNHIGANVGFYVRGGEAEFECRAFTPSDQ